MQDLNPHKTVLETAALPIDQWGVMLVFNEPANVYSTNFKFLNIFPSSSTARAVKALSRSGSLKLE